jgi:uncharacterized protein YdcH (DUF465 family)
MSMMIENHSLLNEFPEYKQAIHDLKMGNHHFARLFDEYHIVDKEIHRIEEGIETPSDVYTEKLKKQRLHLKDELYGMIRSAGVAKVG